jgi:hypothetical protein
VEVELQVKVGVMLIQLVEVLADLEKEEFYQLLNHIQHHL